MSKWQLGSFALAAVAIVGAVLWINLYSNRNGEVLDRSGPIVQKESPTPVSVQDQALAGRTVHASPDDRASYSQTEGQEDRGSSRSGRVQGQRTSDLIESLPGERDFLTVSSQVDLDMTARLLQADDFLTRIEDLRSDSFQSADAGELSEVYSEFMESALGQLAEETTLREFACGLRICLGMADFLGDRSDLVRLNNQIHTIVNGPPVYVFVQDIVINPQGPGGINQLRFVMSTDPESNSVSIPLP